MTPIVDKNKQPLTRVVRDNQQCLRCGRFEFEPCNGSGVSVTPCELGRKKEPEKR